MANSRNAHRNFVGNIYFKYITFSDKLFHTSSLLLFIITDKVMSQTDKHTIGRRVGEIFHRELTYRGSRMAAHFHQHPRFKMCGVVPPLLISFHGMALNYAQGQTSLNSTLSQNILS
jgi:hypothetical protein